ncbi:23S rRNA (pseudouridine(1915)-N(3))-methyltransferase RlmH [Paenibacillus faecalis]|uniref:23S rRNA (pseudouridine(1915)-N(3))-methyltransferase RlmH n=1 Tax=Paenibacillus faecalis TaxID=2079532 RepID=UPI000D0E5967|nr:23S rRNA (pseudouridine(1915)-N(3))-methyltransferase RlmH [Paenibacillus faecalis]
MRITIYTISERIETFYIEAIKEYQKRLGRYCTINFFPLKRANMLENKIKNNSYKILINNTGKTSPSEKLALKLNQLGVTGTSDLSFIIGSDSTIYDETITLSQMEMDIGLKTTILIEQLYRAFRIIHNHPYHK